MAMREYIFRIPSMTHGIECEFDDLCQDADNDRNKENEIILEWFHSGVCLYV